MKTPKDSTDFEQFAYMYANFERLENGEIKHLAEHMSEAFGILKETAHIKLTNYHYNRSIRRPIRGQEINGEIILTYPSKV